MKVLLQVVKQASVSIDGKIYSEINKGYLLFVGFNYSDNEEIIKKVMDKVMSLRLFMDYQHVLLMDMVLLVIHLIIY